MSSLQSKKICASCVHFKLNAIIRSTEKRKPTWLHEVDYVREFIAKQHKFTPRTPAHANISVTIQLPTTLKNRKVLFWGSKKSMNELRVNDARTAYGHFRNNGITTVGPDGTAQIRLRCPQIYRVQKTSTSSPLSYFKHLHFVVSNAKCTKWNKQLYTHIVVCKSTIESTLSKHQRKKVILINTLPTSMHRRSHIPQSWNLPTSKIQKKTGDEIQSLIEKRAAEMGGPVLAALQNGSITLLETPIVLYCASSTCRSSDHAAKLLLQMGFVNIRIMQNGMKGFLEYTK